TFLNSFIIYNFLYNRIITWQKKKNKVKLENRKLKIINLLKKVDTKAIGDRITTETSANHMTKLKMLGN
ncbi:hypothetical protein PSZ46_23320, partial [Shigella flexneri]|nr:hypothetical protein [Shigella flexneri]